MSQEEKDLYLHAVIVKKPVKLSEARFIAQEYIKDKKKTLVRETEEGFRFRNIPKKAFHDLITKNINDSISLVVGHLNE